MYNWVIPLSRESGGGGVTVGGESEQSGGCASPAHQQVSGSSAHPQVCLWSSAPPSFPPRLPISPVFPSPVWDHVGPYIEFPVSSLSVVLHGSWLAEGLIGFPDRMPTGLVRRFGVRNILQSTMHQASEILSSSCPSYSSISNINVA